jgi:uncharacterized RDD family membrane protein YckC
MSGIESTFDGVISEESEGKVEPENSLIPKKLPALYQRYFARLIDYIFIFTCAYYISVYTKFFSNDSIEQFVPIIIALFIYDAFFTSTLCTVGQLVLNFRVRNHDDLSRVGFLTALMRTVIKLLFGAYSLIAILFNRERRAVHDLFTGTIAIYPKDAK